MRDSTSHGKLTADFVLNQITSSSQLSCLTGETATMPRQALLLPQPRSDINFLTGLASPAQHNCTHASCRLHDNWQIPLGEHVVDGLHGDGHVARLPRRPLRQDPTSSGRHSLGEDLLDSSRGPSPAASCTSSVHCAGLEGGEAAGTQLRHE